MPIAGITGRGLNFPTIGQIRKGGPKRKKTRQDGSEYEIMGVDLEYFRATFDAGEEDAAAAFLEAFGPQPKDITIWLPFNDKDRCWNAWREAYDAGTRVHQCDGKLIIRAIDHNTGELLVKDGLDVKSGKPVPCNGIAYYQEKRGQRVAVECSPVGRLRFIVPALKRLACMTFSTGSEYDVSELDSQLDGIFATNGGKVVGVPLVLKRRERAVSVRSGQGGKKQRMNKWLVSIETASEWTAAKFDALQVDAMPQRMLPPGFRPAYMSQPGSVGTDQLAGLEGERIVEMDDAEDSTEPPDDMGEGESELLAQREAVGRAPENAGEWDPSDQLREVHQNFSGQEPPRAARLEAAKPTGTALEAPPAPAVVKAVLPPPAPAAGPSTAVPGASTPPVATGFIRDLPAWRKMLEWGKEHGYGQPEHLMNALKAEGFRTFLATDYALAIPKLEARIARKAAEMAAQEQEQRK